MAQWYFNTYRPGDKVRDPIGGEFFSSEAISDPGRALVREGIQNSLDAAIGNDPVLVRIYVSGDENAVKYENVEPFFKGGWDHFHASSNGLRDAPSISEPCRFLVFEDFHTKGLTGDISEIRHIPDQKNAFFHFFRADGISDKGEGDRGRWGVGKTVFQRASRLNTMFGLTVRHDDSRALLMGMSVLKGHRLHNADYMPDGWLGSRNDENIVMPLEDINILQRFRTCFSLDRGSESGLSIVVPWLDSEVTEGAIVEAALWDYFYPILTGRLEVIVKTPSAEITVSKDSLNAEIAHIGGELERKLTPLIDLARWALEQDSTKIPKLDNCETIRAMEWDEKLIPEQLRPHLTRQLMNNERLAVRVPVNVREKGKSVQYSFFDVFMVRDGSDGGDRPVYVREGLIIPDVRAPRSRGLTSLVIADDRPLAAFLGDSENPSHTQWQHDGSHFKGKYQSGRADLEFVIGSVRAIQRVLEGTESEEDPNLLVDIFNLPDGALLEKHPGDGKDGTATKVHDDIKAGRPKLFKLSATDGGFVVEAAGATAALEIPPCLDIIAAYEVRRGNAFNRYISADFDFKDTAFSIMLHDASILSRADNRIRVKLDGGDFRVTVTGFDVRRDVRVNILAVEAPHVDPIV